MSEETYRAKHEKRWYSVWRVLGPAGPEETIQVYGRDEAREAVKGCWDWCVRDLETGEELKNL